MAGTKLWHPEAVSAIPSNTMAERPAHRAPANNRDGFLFAGDETITLPPLISNKTQYPFQWQYSVGRIINIGCGNDGANLKHDWGAFNVDICAVDPVSGNPAKHDLIADARDLPAHLHSRFDTAVLGEILEHFTQEDRVKALISAKKCLAPFGHLVGRLVITFPEDERSQEEQYRVGHNKSLEPRWYAPGIPAFHDGKISLAEILSDLGEAGFPCYHSAALDYGFTTGYGIVAFPKKVRIRMAGEPSHGEAVN